MILNSASATPSGGFLASADDFNIFHSASQFRQQVLHLIQQAKQRIYICALYLEGDDTGKAVLTALYQAKQQNPQLEIKIFVDYHRAQRGLIGQKASSTNRDVYLEFAQQYQEQIAIYGVPVKSKELFGVLHLKGFVFDDILFYSGASINNIYMQFADKYRCDRYYQIQQQQLADSFCQLLDKLRVKANLPQLNQAVHLNKKALKQVIRTTQNVLKQSHYQSTVNLKASQPIVIQPLLGCGVRKNGLNQQIRQTLQQAQYNLLIFTPYFNLPKPLLTEVKKALKRGVEVTIVIGDKTANDFYIADPQDFSTVGIVPYIYENLLRRFIKRFQRFIDAGKLKVQLWKAGNNSYHLKGIIADGKQHIITGHNLNPRAWRLDAENGLVIDDPQQTLQSKWQAEVDHIMQNTTQIMHHSQLQPFAEYPQPVQKLLKRVNRTQLGRILQRFL